MRKYKLIKTYPGSPQGGTIVKKDDLGQYVAEGPLLILDKIEVEGYPSFWELTEDSLSRAETIKLSHKEEPNYLITAFRETKDLFGERKIASLGKNGLYGGWHTLEGMLKNPPCVESNDFEIYSVKNSKGEEFTIGDKVTDKVECFIIKSFDLNEAYIDGCFARGKGDGRMVGCSIKLLEKVKTPIYTTTDGVDIYKGDEHNGLYLLNKDLTLPQDPSARVVYSFNSQDAEVCNRYLTFTSEENRDKYIKENTRKPIFVSADGKDMYEGDMVYMAILQSKTIVPYHAGKDSTEGGIRFSSHEAASEYLKKLNPIFTSADGKDMYEGDTVWHFTDELDFQLSSSIVRERNIYGKIRFSTEEKAKEYIEFNKPKYSLADIENCYPHANITGNRIKDIPVVAALFSNLKKLGK